MKLKIFVAIFIFALLLWNSSLFAQEEITITTYYPSPYGSYNELDVYRKINFKEFSSGFAQLNSKLLFYSDPNNDRNWAGMGVHSDGYLWIRTGLENRPGDGNFFVIQSSGNVGIGTRNPRTSLHIPRAGIQIGDSIADVQNFHLVSTDDNGCPGLRLYVGNYGAGRQRMTWRSDGNVGIGTDTPSTKLSILGTQHWSGGLLVSSDPWSPSISIAGVSVNGIDWDNSGIYSFPNGDLTIQPRWHTGTQQLLLNPYAGNVGIGTLTPGQKLDVNGNIRANAVCLGTSCIDRWVNCTSGWANWTRQDDARFWTGLNPFNLNDFMYGRRPSNSRGQCSAGQQIIFDGGTCGGGSYAINSAFYANPYMRLDCQAFPVPRRATTAEIFWRCCTN